MTRLPVHLLLLLLLFILASCPPAEAQLNHPFILEFPDSLWPLDTTWTMKPDASYPAYHIRICIPSEDSGSVTITKQAPSKAHVPSDIINVIALCPELGWSLTHYLELLKFDDINFDGFDDIFVLDGVDERTGASSFKIWLFDPSSGAFRYNEQFSENVYRQYVTDETKKTITSTWSNFPDPYGYGTETYKVQGDKLLLIDRVTQSYDVELSGDTARVYIWKHEKLIHGVLRIIKQVQKTEAQLLKEEN